MRHSLLASSLLLLPLTAQGLRNVDGPDVQPSGAFDPVRDRLVLFGADGATWEVANGVLLHRPTVGGPSPRRGAAMVYDGLRRRVVLFGGRETTTLALHDDTWAWDGVAWTRLPTAVAPSPRESAAVAFDPVRDRIVLFGGAAGAPVQGTWEFDGSSWQLRQPALSPANSGWARMAYDARRQLMVLAQHSGGNPGPLPTWEWNGSSWRMRSVGTTWPTTRTEFELTFDAGRGVTVLSGGAGHNAQGGQWWEWDGSSWRLAASLTEPRRFGHVAWYDAQRRGVRMFGGFAQFGVGAWEPYRSDAWHWNGAALTRVHGELRPSTRSDYWLSADLVAGEAVLFSGTQASGSPTDTWVWNGDSWRELVLPNQPIGRFGAAATFDPFRRRHWLFGGHGGVGGNVGWTIDDLWYFDQGVWTAVAAPTSPPARGAAGLAYDNARNRLVLFGGWAPASFLSDTWEWDGTSWLQAAPSQSPPARRRMGMTFDVGRNRTVLFGGNFGFNAQDQLADTWEYDGRQWLQIQVPQAPPPLMQPSLAYDLGRFETRMVGQVYTGVMQTHLQSWRFAGSQWTQIAAATNTTVSEPKLALSLAGQRMTVFDGNGMVVEWLLGGAAQSTSYGSACGAPATRLAARTRPRLGASAFGFETMVGAGELVVFTLGLQPGNLPLGNGCFLALGSIDASMLAVAGPTGFVEQVLPLPRNPVWFGAALFAQAVVIDPATNGLRTSQGLRNDLGN